MNEEKEQIAISPDFSEVYPLPSASGFNYYFIFRCGASHKQNFRGVIIPFNNQNGAEMSNQSGFASEWRVISSRIWFRVVAGCQFQRVWALVESRTIQGISKGRFSGFETTS